MKDYLLPNYQLSCLELVQSLVVSEYGLRHLEQADLQPERKWGHRLIALIEFIPVLGQVVMLVEWIAFKHLIGSAQRVEDSIPHKEWLFKGSQRDCDGSVPQGRVASVFARLITHKENGIEFNPAKLTGHVDGGVCTAMALDFADAFFHARKVHAKVGQRSTETFLNSIRDLWKRFERSSEEMRVRQAAFNSIEVRGPIVGVDSAKNKIQSLANLHNYRIDHTSREIHIDQANCSNVIQEEVSKLPDGLYLLRSIEPLNNERLEKHGHSMIYVKDQQEGFFYDPNYGTKYMSNIDHASELSQNLIKCYQQFQVSKARFYRLTPNLLASE